MGFIVGNVMAIMRNDEILLINRNKYPFVGFWGLPGGKIKPGETIKECALREGLEETGLEMDFHSFRGTVSARITENGKELNHFMLLVCRLNPKQGEVKESEEGELRWFRLGELEGMKEKIIPDDLHMIKEMVMKDNDRNFRSMMEKKGKEYFLKEFRVNNYEKE